MSMSNLAKRFNTYFDIVPAITDDLKEASYKLRYQVYCLENDFENPDEFQDKMEFDEYDRHSVHYLVQHRKSKDYAATVRLILPDTNSPGKPFPIEQHCAIDYPDSMQNIDRKHLAEGSRLCVSKAFRQRRNNLDVAGNNTEDYFSSEEKQTFPLISLVLIACCTKASFENDIHYSLSVMEPAWFRILKSFGILYTQIGPLTNHHGERFPTIIKVTDMLDKAASINPSVRSILTGSSIYIPDSRHYASMQEAA